MKVSVLIANYNYGRYLGEAIRSVLSQVYDGGVECIVVDDGSTDNSLEVLKGFGSSVTYVAQKNSGQAAAINSAFALSSGDVICFLDSDDLFDPDKVSCVAKSFMEDPGVGVVHHSMRLVGATGTWADWSGQPSRREVCTTQSGDGDLRPLMRQKALPWRLTATSGLSLRRSVGLAVFPLETHLKRDADALIGTSAALISSVKHIRRVLGSYRRYSPEAYPQRSPEYAMELIQEKILHGNRVLSRMGGVSGLTPLGSWDYVVALAAAKGMHPVFLVGRALAAVLRAEPLTPFDRLHAVLYLLNRAAKSTYRRGQKGGWSARPSPALTPRR